MKEKIFNSKKAKLIFNFIYRLLFINRINNNGKNNKIIYNDAIIKNVKISIKGNNNKIIISKNCRLINYNIYLKGDCHELYIGENCILRNGQFWFEDKCCKISIGKNTTSEGSNIYIMEDNKQINIGEGCMLSFDIDIRNSDAHSIVDIESKKRINYATNITIGNNVWIGAHTQVLKNSKINDNTIIGIRSLVTKEVKGNCIAVGSPIRVKKENVYWDRERIN